MAEGYDLLGTFNWTDHLPLLKWLDLQGVRRRCNRLVQKVEVIVGKIIQEHRERRAGGGGVADEITGDFVDVLLGLEGDDKMSDSDMIAVLWVRRSSNFFVAQCMLFNLIFIAFQFLCSIFDVLYVLFSSSGNDL